MNKRLRILITSIAILISLGATGFVLYQNGIIFPKTEQTQQKSVITFTNNGKEATYKGKNNKTALSLLQNATNVIVSGTGENSFVTSINGITADSTKEFWSFSVDGIDASVGAGSYITKDNETITWKLTTF